MNCLSMTTSISNDGFLRIPLLRFTRLQLRHLASGIDEDEQCGVAPRCGGPTTISGYTEWVCDTEPGLSIGWDWVLASDRGIAVWKRFGLPRSNAMLTDEMQHEFGWLPTLHLLADAVDALSWHEKTRNAVIGQNSE